MLNIFLLALGALLSLCHVITLASRSDIGQPDSVCRMSHRKVLTAALGAAKDLSRPEGAVSTIRSISN